MDTLLRSSVTHLTDEELISRVRQLAAHERDVTAVLIAHLAELDARRLYLADGWPSLFAYCTQVLHLSEHAAYGRMQAARAVRKFPIVLDRLADGSVNDRALTALLQDLARKKLAATDRPRESRGSPPGSRHIPAEVKRAVWRQDGGRCAFVSPSGRRCSARGFLEFHHVVPHAMGGQAAVDNIQLRCRAHNGYEAERSLGRRGPGAVREPRATYSVRTEFGCGSSFHHTFGWTMARSRRALSPPFVDG